MKKPVLFGLVAAIAALGLLFAAIRSAQQDRQIADPSAADDLTITIDGRLFALSGGVAESASVPGSATRDTLRVVGDPVPGDVSGDGKPDAALLLRNDPGGSGTFYYAVVAVNDGGSYHATNVVALGDRIVPETVDFTGGRFVYRFLEREPGQNMADTPTVEKTVPIVFDPVAGTIAPAA